MQGQKNNQQVADANSCFQIAISTAIGDRADQQDSFGYELRFNEGIVVLCDGMGGHAGGKKASDIAVKTILKQYIENDKNVNPIDFLSQSTVEANKMVCMLKNEDGIPLNAGSTLVSVIIKDQMLFWNSVGDSRAYLLRNGEFVQFTVDHKYETVLDEQMRAGLIDEKVYAKENERGEALISYLGIGKLGLVDYNHEPLLLQPDDEIIIMSDGLYKLVCDDEIARVLENFKSIGEALNALEMKAQRAAKQRNISRDNMTVAIIKVL